MPIPFLAVAAKGLGGAALRAGGTAVASKGVQAAGGMGAKQIAGQIGKFGAQGAVVGGAAHLVQNKLGGNEEEQQMDNPDAPGEPAAQQAMMGPQMAPGQYGQMVGAPMPGQMAQPGYMAPGMVPAAVGGAAMATGPGIVATPPATQEAEPEPFAGNDDGFLKSAGKTLLAGAAGAAGGVALKKQDGAEGAGQMIQGALAGAGTGAFTKMGYDAIQKDGAGLRAGLHSGVASMLGSTLKEGGPSKLTSAMMGFGGGSLANFAHDKLEGAGNSKSADAAAGAGLGGALGYSITGDKGKALLSGVGGSGASVGLGAMDRAGGLGGMLRGEKNPLDALTKAGSDQQAPEQDTPELEA